MHSIFTSKESNCTSYYFEKRFTKQKFEWNKKMGNILKNRLTSKSCKFNKSIIVNI